MITPTFSSDIQRIETDYLRDDVVRRKPPPPDTTPVVDPIGLEADIAQPTLFVEQSGTTQPSYMPSTFTTAAPSPYSPTSLQTLIYDVGNLTRFVDARVVIVESEMPKLIDSAIEDALFWLEGKWSNIIRLWHL